MLRRRVTTGFPLCLVWVAAGASSLQAQEWKVDKDSFRLSQVEDDAPVRGDGENASEYAAYNELLLLARSLPPGLLEQKGRRDVTFPDLVRPVRQDYQFDAVVLDGRLRRLRSFEPNKGLAEAGVVSLYEGWVFPDGAADPLCVVFSELPAGLTPSVDDLPSPGVPVTVGGYYFKLMRYEGRLPNKADPGRKQVRKAPLVLAKSLTVRPAPPAADPWQTDSLPAVLAAVGGLTAVALGLAWYLRRGDRRSRAALAASREKNPFE